MVAGLSLGSGSKEDYRWIEWGQLSPTILKSTQLPFLSKDPSSLIPLTPRSVHQPHDY